MRPEASGRPFENGRRESDASPCPQHRSGLRPRVPRACRHRAGAGRGPAHQHAAMRHPAGGRPCRAASAHAHRCRQDQHLGVLLRRERVHRQRAPEQHRPLDADPGPLRVPDLGGDHHHHEADRRGQEEGLRHRQSADQQRHRPDQQQALPVSVEHHGRSLLADPGLLLPGQDAEHLQLRNADPRPAEHRLWRRVHARQPAPTGGHHDDVHRHDGWDHRIPDCSDHRRHHVDRPRLGPAPLWTVRPMTRLVLILPALTVASIAPAAAQTCLQVDVIERAGEAVSSPYGVDRTGRASAGFHQGLDLVNTTRQSGAVTSGLAGTVVGKLAPRGGVNLVEVVTGNMKYQYMHLEHIETQAAENPTVTAGQKLGMMGRAGASAVHLHLGALLSGQALQSYTGGGRFWLQQRGSKGASPLTADQIKSAAPRAWYYVNPEPFLTHQVPYQSGASSYNQPGGARTVTLPRICSPAEAIAAPGGDETKQPSGQVRTDPTSEADGGSSQGTIEAHASGRVASEGPSVALASQAPRGVLLEIARGGATELMAHQLSTQGELDSSLAHLALIVATAPAAPQPAP